MSAPLLEVRGLVKTYPIRSGLWGRRRELRAVDGVDLTVGQGEIVGLVGESGSGKTTLGRSILRLIEPTDGRVLFDGIDVRALGAGQLRRFRRRMQLVFQDPGAALNPRMKVRTLVGEPLVIHGIAHGRRLEDKVAALLDEVGLEPAAMDRYPHEFSGGQRQRIGIARALALRPEFVVCDEPVSALDVSVQAQIINLLARLQQRLGLAYLLIAHDLSLVTHLCDRVLVLYLGRVMETGPGKQLHHQPLHPYTRALFDAAASADQPAAASEVRPLAGEIPSPVDLPSGCRFHPRCPWAEPRCRQEEPELRAVGGERWVACHLAGDDR